MGNDLIVRCKQWIIRFRLGIAIRIFPSNRGCICANRSMQEYETDALCVSLTIRDKREADGYSWEEMLRIFDVWLGRKATTEEWSQMIAWKVGRK